MMNTKKFKKSKFLIFWFPVFIYSGIIFLVSSLPHLGETVHLGSFDKGAHLIEYVPFGFLLARAFNETIRPCSLMLNAFLVVSFTFAYGLSDEFHQSFVAGRYFSLMDLGADVFGAVIGLLIFNKVKKVSVHHRS